MKAVTNLFLLSLTMILIASCSETVQEYRVQKAQKQIYQNRLELYKETH